MLPSIYFVDDFQNRLRILTYCTFNLTGSKKAVHQCSSKETMLEHFPSSETSCPKNNWVLVWNSTPTRAEVTHTMCRINVAKKAHTNTHNGDQVTNWIIQQHPTQGDAV